MVSAAASNSTAKIAAEKSLPLRPSVVMAPCESRAMKPVTTTSRCGCAARQPASRARLPAQSTATPNSPGCTTSTSRASSRAQPAASPPSAACSRCADQTSPSPWICAEQAGDGASCSSTRNASSNALIATGSGESAPGSSVCAAAWCRACNSAQRASQAPTWPAACANAVSASVTPCIAETTTVRGPSGSACTRPATWRMREASARLLPPNLCTWPRAARAGGSDNEAAGITGSGKGPRMVWIGSRPASRPDAGRVVGRLVRHARPHRRAGSGLGGRGNDGGHASRCKAKRRGCQIFPPRRGHAGRRGLPASRTGDQYSTRVRRVPGIAARASFSRTVSSSDADTSITT